MATTDEDGWVSGPALITAKALRALRVGDRVQVRNMDEGTTLSGTIIEVDPPFKYVPDRLLIRVRRDGAFISLWRNEDQIVAWKPQRPEKT